MQSDFKFAKPRPWIMYIVAAECKHEYRFRWSISKDMTLSISIEYVNLFWPSNHNNISACENHFFWNWTVYISTIVENNALLISFEINKISLLINCYLLKNSYWFDLFFFSFVKQNFLMAVQLHSTVLAKVVQNKAQFFFSWVSFMSHQFFFVFSTINF
jgi:hypothetical protein